jgi:hypothetical protein
VTSEIPFLDGTSTSCWPQSFCFWFRGRPPFHPRGLELKQLLPNCSLIRAARFESHGPLKDTPPLVCFCGRLSLLVVTGSLWCWVCILAILTEAQWAALELVLVRLSTVFMGPSSRSTATLLHRAAASSVLPFLQGTLKRSRPGALQWHILIAQSHYVSAKIHGCIVGVHDVDSQDELTGYIGDEEPSC